MAQPILPVLLDHIYEVVVYCGFQNQISNTVLHYRVQNPPSGLVTQENMANQLSQFMSPLFADMLAVDANYHGLTVQKIFPLTKDPKIASVTLAAPGEQDSDTLPSQAAGAILKLTTEVGSRYRGLIYVPFPTEAMNDVDGTPNAAGITLMETLAGGVLQVINLTVDTIAVDLEPVVWSRLFSTGQTVAGWKVQSHWITHKSRGLNRRGDVLQP